MGDVTGPESVRAIPGIGPFWASGIYLRGCGIQDVFPVEEPISVAALGVLHGEGLEIGPERAQALALAYRPFRMWVCFLLRVAVGRGLITGIAGREMELRRGLKASGRSGSSTTPRRRSR